MDCVELSHPVTSREEDRQRKQLPKKLYSHERGYAGRIFRLILLLTYYLCPFSADPVLQEEYKNAETPRCESHTWGSCTRYALPSGIAS